MEINLSEISEVIINRGLNLDEYLNLYQQNKLQDLFQKAIKDDVLEIVELLFQTSLVRFYLNDYITNMNADLFEELNNEEKSKSDKHYKILFKCNKSEKSLEYLNYMKRYSKLHKDEKGFYYIFNQKYFL